MGQINIIHSINALPLNHTKAHAGLSANLERKRDKEANCLFIAENKQASDQTVVNKAVSHPESWQSHCLFCKISTLYLGNH